MITVINDNRVSDREKYLPLAKAFAEESAAVEKDCLGMEVYADLEQEDRVVYISRWETKEDFQATVGGAVFNKHIPVMAPYYVSGTDSFLESI